MMKMMGGLDAMFLASETPRTYMHTFKIAILDPSSHEEGWDFQRYRERLQNRLHHIPLFRWRYLPAPLGLGHPMWVEDPDFHLDYHLRRVACPAPGDHRALCEFMSSVYAYQLDRSRPLWVSWIVEGLEGGKVANVTLVHHAYVDGAGASQAMQQFFDLEPCDGEDPEPPRWSPAPIPSWSSRLWAGVAAMPGLIARGLPLAVSGARKKREVEQAYRDAGKPPHPSPEDMPATPLNRVLSHGRTFVCESMPLELVSKARIVEGTTINDVFLCCAAGALRRLLRDMGYDPTQGPLVAGIPVAGERPPGMEGEGNFVFTDFTWLHIEIEDPLERLIATRKSSVEFKEHLEAARGSGIIGVAQLAPTLLTRFITWSVRRKGGKFGLNGNVVISNVPGPRKPLYFGPIEVANWFSTGQVFDGTSLNMTLWSYCGKANLCILADSEVLPDGWVLYDLFCEELAKLDELADGNPDRQASA
jgi:WS/DGAT/MGAT family acyltransferase